MKDTNTPRDVSESPPPPPPKLGPAGRASIAGDLTAPETNAARIGESPPAGDVPLPTAAASTDAKSPPAREPTMTRDSDQPLSPERKEELRHLTPSAKIRETVNDVPESQKVDPVYGYKVDRFEADHIVPYNSVVAMKGFSQLDHTNQEAVVNYPANFMGLDRRTNASKGDKSWAEWPGHPTYGPVPAELRAQMIAREQTLRPELQGEIDKRLATQAGN
ncbi:MAG: hypothetical protein K1X50_13015 [Candidatus Promineofilum sp.]|nr:hypothetical protein [Promineifilum sp.]